VNLSLTPNSNTRSIVLPEVRVLQFDPSIRKTSFLILPPLPLQFTHAAAKPRPIPPLPRLQDRLTSYLLLIAAMTSFGMMLKNFWPKKIRKIPDLQRIFRRNNPNLAISRNAAQKLYRDLALEVYKYDEAPGSLIDILKQHLPQEEWLNISRAFRKLERTAFSDTRPQTVTYGEMKNACQRVEITWLQ
jgi:hypothetical protein